MYANPRWHADALRWLGSLLLGAADYLERAPIDGSPCEPLPAHLAHADESLDEVRARIHLSCY
jgi:hypothetical protein